MMMIKAEPTANAAAADTVPTSSSNSSSGHETGTSPCSSALKRKNNDQDGGVGEPRTKSTLHQDLVTSASSRSVVTSVDESSVSSTDTVGVTTRSKRSLNKHSTTTDNGNGGALKKSPGNGREDSAASDEDISGQEATTVSKGTSRKRRTTVKGRGLGSRMTSRSGLRHMAQKSKDHAIRTK